MVAEAAKAAATTATEGGKKALSTAWSVVSNKWTWIGLSVCALAAAGPVAAAFGKFAAAPSVGSAGGIATTAVGEGAPAVYNFLGGIAAKFKGASTVASAGATTGATAGAAVAAPMIPPATDIVGGNLTV